MSAPFDQQRTPSSGSTVTVASGPALQFGGTKGYSLAAPRPPRVESATYRVRDAAVIAAWVAYLAHTERGRLVAGDAYVAATVDARHAYDLEVSAIPALVVTFRAAPRESR
jgi:hypothetical protein